MTNFQPEWDWLILLKRELNISNVPGQYFLESKMEFLDSEEEWFIDDKFIYVWPPQGVCPDVSKVWVYFLIYIRISKS